MCFQCVAEKMTEAELLRSYEFAQNNIGLARAVGNTASVDDFSFVMRITGAIWNNREREMIAQLIAGQSILMDYIKQKKEQ